MRWQLYLMTLIIITACKRAHPPVSASQSLAEIYDRMPTSKGWGRSAGTAPLDSTYFLHQAGEVRRFLDQLQSVDTSALTFDERIDYRFAHSLLSGQLIDHTLIQSWRKDPRLYMSFTDISRIIGKPGVPENKWPEIKKLLGIMPTQLKHAALQLTNYVPRFQELGLFMAENGRVLFNQELPQFMREYGAPDQGLDSLLDAGQVALEAYISFLKNDLPRRPSGTFAIGQEAYDRMLKEEFLLPYNHQTLYDYGWAQFEQTTRELEALAAKLDASKSWQQIAAEVKQEYPHPDSIIEAHQYWVDRAANHIRQHDLISIPWAERVTVVPRAEYLRKTSYYGNFSLAQGKNADSVFASEWQINPFEYQWDERRKQEYLTEHDWGVIIVTAPHETYAGHHIQGLYQRHLPSKLRRENGLSLFSEGWGLYNEQLMQETGFFPDEKIHLRQLQLRLWRNARVIYDVGLHTGKMTYTEAIALMTERVGFLHWAAQLEVDAACASPGYFIGYFMGMSEILKLREAYRAKLGEQFTLKKFHEDLLNIGNMPPALMAELLLR